MKKTLPILLTLALTAAGASQAAAGNREWATAGKVLTGVVAASVIARALDPGPPIYVAPAYPTPVYTTTIACPPTRVIVSTPAIPPVAIVPPAPSIVVYQEPVYVQPVYVQPACAQPVYVPPAPVYYVQPAPVYVQRAPIYVAPPFVSVRFGFGGYHRGGHGRW